MIRLALAAVVVSGIAQVAWAQALCVDGHPARRSGHVTYGGAPLKPGYERDHVIPLCLGGSDTAGNIQYQPWGEAIRKDAVERHACRAYCAGQMTLDQALRLVRRWDE